jgi:hypothetical protein
MLAPATSRPQRISQTRLRQRAVKDRNTYKIVATGAAYIKIYDKNGNFITPSGNNQSYVWYAPQIDTHYLSAYSANGSSGSYSIRFFLYEAAPGTSTAAKMTIGTTKTGSMINSGNFDFYGDPNRFPPDEDWVRFEIPAEGCFQIDASLDEPDFLNVVTLLDASGGSLGPLAPCDYQNSCTSRRWLSPARYFLSLLAGPAGETSGITKWSLKVSPLDGVPVVACFD